MKLFKEYIKERIYQIPSGDPHGLARQLIKKYHNLNQIDADEHELRREIKNTFDSLKIDSLKQAVIQELLIIAKNVDDHDSVYGAEMILQIVVPPADDDSPMGATVDDSTIRHL